jgi:hypothetical protein
LANDKQFRAILAAKAMDYYGWLAPPVISTTAATEYFDRAILDYNRLTSASYVVSLRAISALVIVVATDPYQFGHLVLACPYCLPQKRF